MRCGEMAPGDRTGARRKTQSNDGDRENARAQAPHIDGVGSSVGNGNDRVDFSVPRSQGRFPRRYDDAFRGQNRPNNGRPWYGRHWNSGNQRRPQNGDWFGGRPKNGYENGGEDDDDRPPSEGPRENEFPPGLPVNRRPFNDRNDHGSGNRRWDRRRSPRYSDWDNRGNRNGFSDRPCPPVMMSNFVPGAWVHPMHPFMSGPAQSHQFSVAFMQSGNPPRSIAQHHQVHADHRGMLPAINYDWTGYHFFNPFVGGPPPSASPQDFFAAVLRGHQPFGSSSDEESSSEPKEETEEDEELDELDRYSLNLTRVPEMLEIEKRRYSKLTTEIQCVYENHRQSHSIGESKSELLSLVRELLQRELVHLFPDVSASVVGSSITGFGLNTSDMDVCLMVSELDVDHASQCFILTEVMKILSLNASRYGFTDIGFVRAKVPLVKFTHRDSQVDVDLNCNNAVGLCNTRLLYGYGSADWRVCPLIVCVKLWAQRQGINDAKNMSISSYSLVLMVIHYLQVGVQPAILPSLQKLMPDEFSETYSIDRNYAVDLEKLAGTWTQNVQNLTTTGELMMGFLGYYATKFDFKRQAISVRLGKAVPIEDCRNYCNGHNEPAMWKFLCVEEPFLRTNTASSVYNGEVFDRIIEVIKKSYFAILRRPTLKSIFDEKLVPQLPPEYSNGVRMPIPATSMIMTPPAFQPRASPASASSVMSERSLSPNSSDLSEDL